MHGLVGKALHCFAVDTYGEAAWRRAAEAGGAPIAGFDSMRRYDAAAVVGAGTALARQIGVPLADMQADVGTYLVAHENTQPLRRLMRFAGADFDGFLHSLEELPARGRLAVPDLDLPSIRLAERPGEEPGRRVYDLTVRSLHFGAGHVLMGMLRGMADDYGALALLSHEGGRIEDGFAVERLTVEVLMDAYAAGRGFELGAGAAA